jgi:arylsulfatase A-like enzyme
MMKFLKAIVFTLLLAKTVSAAQPNIIIFLVDDMGVMDTSVPFLTDAVGESKRYPLNDFFRTPNMERLAARGIRFNQFNAMSLCSPSRISLITGKNAARHRTTNWINQSSDNGGPNSPPEWNWKGLRKDDVTLPRLLQMAGYRTIQVGKAHFGPGDSEGADPLNLGFDVNIAGGPIGHPASYKGTLDFGAKTKQVANAVKDLEKYHGQDIFLTEALTLEANAQVEQAVKEKKPFFLHLGHYAVHTPFESDSRFADHYKDSGKPPKAQAFATLVEGMDKSLGDLMDHLEKLGVAEDTLILFLGDNGSDSPLGEAHNVGSAAPLRGKKGSHYEGGMRSPFIAAWAKPSDGNANQKKLPVKQGAVQTQFAAIHDIFPTLAGLAGATVPDAYKIDGRKLDTLLAGAADGDHPDAFLMHYPHAPHRSNHFTTYREGDWKVAYHYFPDAKNGSTRYQLFNLKNDPFEQEDLSSSDPANLSRMMKALAAALEEEKALYPVDDAGAPVKPVVP